MTERKDSRTWRESLHELANPVDYGEDTLPPVSQELVDKANEFMEEAERREVDNLIFPYWDDDAVDLVVFDGRNRSPWLSVLVGYADEWNTDKGFPHEPAFMTWHSPGFKDPAGDKCRVLGSVDEALDWLLSF